MAASAPTDDDGFTMEFSLDVFSDIEQDVEDVARQVARGNFRKARRMYEEALKMHPRQVSDLRRVSASMPRQW